MYVLIAGIVVFWIYMLFFRGGSGRASRVNIPQAFICSECNAISVYEKVPKPYPPYKCKSCGLEAAWAAYTCTECIDEETGKPPIFPMIIELPEGVQPPEEGQEPSEEYMQSLMEIEGSIPECPICESSEFVQRYMTEEAKKMLEELREKYRKKRGKKKSEEGSAASN
jgi:hypothetical protein